jgi:hypothetical protein
VPFSSGDHRLEFEALIEDLEKNDAERRRDELLRMAGI